MLLPTNELKDTLFKESHPLNIPFISLIIKSFIYLLLNENSVI